MNSHGKHGYDVLIIGGGVIGLALARELAEQGAKIGVLERGKTGTEASWAGAGMIPPGPPRSHWQRATPLQRMAGLSHELHGCWSEELVAQTGIDVEYRTCGAVRLANTSELSAALEQQVAQWRSLGIRCQEIDAHQLRDLEPELRMLSSTGSQAYLLPQEAQLRNPRYLQALAADCRRRGVGILEDTTVEGFLRAGDKLSAVLTTAGSIAGEKFCLTTGCWTAELLKTVEISLPLKPIRGQIVLLRGPVGAIRRNVCRGLEYLTPRQDGRVLVGSTMEDIGFEKGNTAEATEQLLSFAHELVPAARKWQVEKRWSGLRPSTPAGNPVLGRLPGFENAWIATGHLRAGLQLAPATAVVMSAMIQGKPPPIDVRGLEP